ncbi:MAG: TonB-dependent receptor [Saprospiraceae bacterium]|nr:TonB-dependent receptor [Saprospiraceae bacterium]MCB0624243.1 TonB-dependent receptor [Saprospiraceae bacterium]MCB0679932.1 TonB-dependent receptor [Saprospiraceae bacterium]
MFRFYYLLPALWMTVVFLNPADAQIVIEGQVFDARTGAPLAWATVEEVPGKGGTVTDERGRFKLATEADSLLFRYLGYESMQVPVLINRSLTIGLEPGPIVYHPIAIEIGRISSAYQEPAALTVLQPADLLREEGIQIRKALNRVPGLYMHSGALNTNRITIRGIGSRSPFATAKIRAYLDEIPLTSGVGETTLEDIELGLLSEVDVWKGPSPSAYGAGLGGFVHLKTYRPEALPDSYAETRLTLGSYGLRHWVGQTHYRSEDQRVGLSLQFHQLHSDGYRENNEYDRQGMAVLAKLAPSEKTQSTILVNYLQLKAYIPSSLGLSDFLERPQAAAANWAAIEGYEDYDKLLAGWSIKQELAPKWHFFGSLFTSYRAAYEPRPFNILAENSFALGSRFGMAFSQRRKSQERLQVRLGAEFFAERYAWQTYEILSGELGPPLSDQVEQRRYRNLFSEADIGLAPGWRLQLGLNWNHTRYELEDRFTPDSLDIGGDYAFDPVFSPRVNLQYRRDRTDRMWAVFLTAAHGFSPPTLEETLTPSGAINPDIQPERGWNLEIGWRGKTWQKRFSYDLTLFRMQVDDLLVARRTAEDQFVGINAGSTLHQGLESSLGYYVEWGDAAKGRPFFLSWFARYAFSDFTFLEFVDDDQDFSGNELTGTPRHTLRAGMDLAYRWTSVDRVYLTVGYSFVDAMPIDDANTVYSEAYQTTDLKLGVEQRLGRFSLHFFAGINNLFDERYASMLQINASAFGNSEPRYYYPGLPRNYFTGLRLKWQKSR